VLVNQTAFWALVAIIFIVPLGAAGAILAIWLKLRNEYRPHGTSGAIPGSAPTPVSTEGAESAETMTMR
jgi:hypothetical protein